MAANSVPFTLDHVFGGFGHGEGLIRDEGDHLCVEYQISDPLFQVLKTKLKQIQLPLKDLVSVTLTKGWLGSSWLGVKIVIQAARMEVLQDMPGSSQGRIELSIAAKHRDAAEKFVAELHEQEKDPKQ